MSSCSSHLSSLRVKSSSSPPFIGDFEARTSDGDVMKWISGDGDGKDEIHTIVLKKSVDEITRSVLVERICRKIKVDDYKMEAKISYFPMVMYSNKPSYIWEDEDVFCYLMQVNQENCRSVLHVEFNKRDDDTDFYGRIGAKEGCKWFVRVAKLTNSDLWSVRSYIKQHRCSVVTTRTLPNRRRGTPQIVASILAQDYPGSFDTPRPNALIDLVHQRVAVEVSYTTAYRGRRLAANKVRGTPKESYSLLYCYMHMLEQVNPDTITRVVVDEGKKFKFLFWALGASIEGFRAMRKVFVVDATHLKTVYGGVLFIATAQDSNHHNYPIAFGVADGEKYESWLWFMEQLKSVISDLPGLVILSDRNKGLIKAVHQVFPQAAHRKYPSAVKYLDKSCEQKKWARCYFEGVRCVDVEFLRVDELNSFHLEYSVHGSDGKRYTVDMAMNMCTCGQFDKDKYPCVHAVAAATFMTEKAGKELHLSEYCSKYYLVEQWALAYHRTIYLVPHMSDWVIPEEIRAKKVLPPEFEVKKGKPQQTRKPSAGEARGRGKRGRGSGRGRATSTGTCTGRAIGRGMAAYFECGSGSGSGV
uniref:SWIM-type domain-containing protein n=1 Tax=Brassica oleracea var. oleracea TaxID=109376 RepID=A0A0D3CGT6_BRAOL